MNKFRNIFKIQNSPSASNEGFLDRTKVIQTLHGIGKIKASNQEIGIGFLFQCKVNAGRDLFGLMIHQVLSQNVNLRFLQANELRFEAYLGIACNLQKKLGSPPKLFGEADDRLIFIELNGDYYKNSPSGLKFFEINTPYFEQPIALFTEESCMNMKPIYGQIEGIFVKSFTFNLMKLVNAGGLLVDPTNNAVGIDKGGGSKNRGKRSVALSISCLVPEIRAHASDHITQSPYSEIIEGGVSQVPIQMGPLASTVVAQQQPNSGANNTGMCWFVETRIQ